MRARKINPMQGKTQSEETKLKMSKSHRNRKIIKCVHCGAETTKAMHNRWHGLKCKKREL